MSSDNPEWKQYKLGKRILWIGLLLYLPVVVGVSLLLKNLGLSSAMPFIALGWLAAWLINGIWLACFRCPACGMRFFMWSESFLGVGNVWAAKCHHCGARPPDESAP